MKNLNRKYAQAIGLAALAIGIFIARKACRELSHRMSRISPPQPQR